MPSTNSYTSKSAVDDFFIIALQSLKNLFEGSNELAYLALTQKVEHAVRDKLAFTLHEQLNRNSEAALVCREWKRSDLAILENEKPKAILECKAIYTFDIFSDARQNDFPELVSADFRKAEKLQPEEIYALVIATHPHKAPEKRYRQAVKYFDGITRLANSKYNIKDIESKMAQKMKTSKCIASICIPTGTAFGIKVSIYLWLYKPNHKQFQMNQDAAK